ncbi:MAG: hypothetical protein UW72_C0003G0014 [Parcubacteria group bacterium GW2011_GWF2_44_7]|nr:MAG: hypothetical protein UW72_C0003G0014 [Parcubacteria group bacterium GW2011_GWF2_44_7]
MKNDNLKFKIIFTIGIIGLFFSIYSTTRAGSVYYVSTASEFTAALTSAGAANGGAIYLSAGEYLGTFIVPDNITIQGAGIGNTTLKRPDYSSINNGHVLSLGSNCQVSELTIDGNKTNQNYTENFGSGIIVYEQPNAHDVIEDIEVKNTMLDGILIINSSQVILKNNHTHDTVGYNDINTHNVRAGQAYNGIKIMQHPDYAVPSYVDVIDCVSNDNGLDGIEILSSYVNVKGGYYYGNGRNQNFVDNNFPCAGIFSTYPATNVIIDGVTAYSNNGNGIDIDAANNLLITNSHSYLNGIAGIFITNSPDGNVPPANVTIIGNKAYNNDKISYEFNIHGGIFVSGGDNITVTDNFIYDSQANHTQLYGIYLGCYTGAPALSNSTVNNNFSFGNKTADYSFNITPINCSLSSTNTTNTPSYGWLDYANAIHITGWAYDADAGVNPINVKIYIDETEAANIVANISKPDLSTFGIQGINHGFDYIFPTLAVGKHIIEVYAINTPTGYNYELSGSPKTITIVEAIPPAAPQGLSVQ